MVPPSHLRRSLVSGLVLSPLSLPTSLPAASHPPPGPLFEAPRFPNPPCSPLPLSDERVGKWGKREWILARSSCFPRSLLCDWIAASLAVWAGNGHRSWIIRCGPQNRTAQDSSQLPPHLTIDPAATTTHSLSAPAVPFVLPPHLCVHSSRAVSVSIHPRNSLPGNSAERPSSLSPPPSLLALTALALLRNTFPPLRLFLASLVRNPRAGGTHPGILSRWQPDVVEKAAQGGSENTQHDGLHAQRLGRHSHAATPLSPQSTIASRSPLRFPSLSFVDPFSFRVRSSMSFSVTAYNVGHIQTIAPEISVDNSYSASFCCVRGRPFAQRDLVLFYV